MYLTNNLDVQERRDESTEEQRGAHVPLVIRFGRECAAQYPLVSQMVRVYVAFNLEMTFTKLRMVRYYVDALNIIYGNLATICARAATQFGEETCIYVNHWAFDESYIRTYTRRSLLSYCYEQLLDYEDILVSTEAWLLTKLHQRIDIYERMVLSLDALFPGEAKLRAGRPGRGAQEFIHAVLEFGEDHWEIWRCQHTFKEPAMRYLLMYPEDLAALAALAAVPESMASDLDTSMGCLCASGPNCRLEVHRIDAAGPAVWRVGVHDDGSEYIDSVQES